MATTTYPAGTKFADWSSARNVFGPLEAIGVKVASRYISPSFSPQITSGKCLSIPERDEFFARGWGLLVNWESSATDALGGAPLGARYGAMCLRQLRILQHPVDVRVRISVSCDTDARNSLPTVNAYFHAFHDALGEYAPQMDAYGGSYECNALAWCGPHWLTTSHGWSDPAVWAAINNGEWGSQLLNNLYGFQTPVGSTSQWDMDMLIKPVTVWTGLGADHNPVIVPQPAPAPSGTFKENSNMIIIYTVDDAAGKGIYLFSPAGFLHIGNGELVDQLKAVGVPTLSWNQHMCDIACDQFGIPHI